MVAGQGFNPGVSGGGGGGVGYEGSAIAFTAVRATPRSLSGLYGEGRVNFERSLTNLGGGWVAREPGVFTTPASGVYSFSWTGLSRAGSELRLDLVVNQLEMGSSWADREGYQAAGGQVVLGLRRGDRVWLRQVQGEIYEPADCDRGYTRLTGYRIA